ncbi:MAG TPA: ABC transporter substrate-binding protein [Hyphomicrobiaceae bacterium]|nr:ABC transporter substrate-binding protein [Hyphomicrobiaceae bacterium]
MTAIARGFIAAFAAAALGLTAFAGGAQAAKVRVALGDTISVETLSYLIALERAKEKGADYEVTSFAKEELAIQAVVNGQADIGIATPYAVIQKSKAPLRGLFQVSRLVFFPVAAKQYKTWKDLDGQPFAFHARGSGTEAIGNILAKRNGIKFGQRSYVPGSENRVVAMLNGQIKATIVDLANMKLLMAKGGDRFHVLPSVDTPASDEVLFGNVAWMQKNAATVDILVESFARLWSEMAKDPGVIEAERVKRNLLKDLPKEVVAGVSGYYADAIKHGLFDPKGGGAAAVKADFEFYTEAGQLKGKAGDLKVEDFWNLGPLEKALKKIGS